MNIFMGRFIADRQPWLWPLC